VDLLAVASVVGRRFDRDGGRHRRVPPGQRYFLLTAHPRRGLEHEPGRLRFSTTLFRVSFTTGCKRGGRRCTGGGLLERHIAPRRVAYAAWHGRLVTAIARSPR
jgi:hypothetical protein